MTDKQIRVELARRVMGWERDSEGYWDPFEDWNDAMELAEKWLENNPGARIIHHISHTTGSSLTNEHYIEIFRACEYIDCASAGAAFGPRAICLALAEAVGIEAVATEVIAALFSTGEPEHPDTVKCDCKFSNAWRCARSTHSSVTACRCACHRSAIDALKEVEHG